MPQPSDPSLVDGSGPMRGRYKPLYDNTQSRDRVLELEVDYQRKCMCRMPPWLAWERRQGAPPDDYFEVQHPKLAADFLAKVDKDEISFDEIYDATAVQNKAQTSAGRFEEDYGLALMQTLRHNSYIRVGQDYFIPRVRKQSIPEGDRANENRFLPSYCAYWEFDGENIDKGLHKEEFEKMLWPASYNGHSMYEAARSSEHEVLLALPDCKRLAEDTALITDAAVRDKVAGECSENFSWCRAEYILQTPFKSLTLWDKMSCANNGEPLPQDARRDTPWLQVSLAGTQLTAKQVQSEEKVQYPAGVLKAKSGDKAPVPYSADDVNLKRPLCNPSSKRVILQSKLDGELKNLNGGCGDPDLMNNKEACINAFLPRDKNVRPCIWVRSDSRGVDESDRPRRNGGYRCGNFDVWHPLCFPDESDRLPIQVWREDYLLTSTVTADGRLLAVLKHNRKAPENLYKTPETSNALRWIDPETSADCESHKLDLLLRLVPLPFHENVVESANQARCRAAYNLANASSIETRAVIRALCERQAQMPGATFATAFAACMEEVVGWNAAHAEVSLKRGYNAPHACSPLQARRLDGISVPAADDECPAPRGDDPTHLTRTQQIWKGGTTEEEIARDTARSSCHCQLRYMSAQGMQDDLRSLNALRSFARDCAEFAYSLSPFHQPPPVHGGSWYETSHVLAYAAEGSAPSNEIAAYEQIRSHHLCLWSFPWAPLNHLPSRAYSSCLFVELDQAALRAVGIYASDEVVTAAGEVEADRLRDAQEQLHAAFAASNSYPYVDQQNGVEGSVCVVKARRAGALDASTLQTSPVETSALELRVHCERRSPPEQLSRQTVDVELQLAGYLSALNNVNLGTTAAPWVSALNSGLVPPAFATGVRVSPGGLENAAAFALRRTEEGFERLSCDTDVAPGARLGFAMYMMIDTIMTRDTLLGVAAARSKESKVAHESALQAALQTEAQVADWQVAASSLWSDLSA